MEPIQVVGMRPAWGLPSSSPFCLKLETWLRMEKIPYTPIALTKPPRSDTGKVPYLLRADGSTVADSNFIISTMANELNIDLAHGATAEERARTHLILRTLEESLYFVAVWERWQQAEYWPTTREAIFGYLPPVLRQLLAMTIRRKMLASLQGQGIARHDPVRIAAIGQADLAALSTLLGERPYFHGDRPGVADASAYGTLANLLGFPHATPLKRAVERHANLVDFCGRMNKAYWSEVHGDYVKAFCDPSRLSRLVPIESPLPTSGSHHRRSGRTQEPLFADEFNHVIYEGNGAINAR